MPPQEHRGEREQHVGEPEEEPTVGTAPVITVTVAPAAFLPRGLVSANAPDMMLCAPLLDWGCPADKHEHSV